MTRRGFTLIEAMVGVAIAAIVARTAVLATVSLTAALRVAATTRTLAQAMRETRARAMAEGEPVDVVFDASASRWTVRALDGTIRHLEPLADPVRFVSLPARSSVRFTSTGTADNATIVLGTSNATGRIIVNQRGRVRLG